MVGTNAKPAKTGRDVAASPRPAFITGGLALGRVQANLAIMPVDAIRAIQLTSRFPMVHGAPVHMGNPRPIGIEDLHTQCDSTFIPCSEDEEIPLFRA